MEHVLAETAVPPGVGAGRQMSIADPGANPTLGLALEVAQRNLRLPSRTVPLHLPLRV
jgi:hypothetical protein